MRLVSLSCSAFRSYPELAWQPADGINLLCGANAQGKTNLLEAIYLLATSRSPRSTRESDLIFRDSPGAQLGAVVESQAAGRVEVELGIYRDSPKRVTINGSPAPRLIDILGRINAVYFGASDLRVVQSDPSERRRFLDLEIAQASPAYAIHLIRYREAHAQRNHLLRSLRDSGRDGEDAGLEAWNLRLAQCGSAVSLRRWQFINVMAPLAAQLYADLCSTPHCFSVRYAANVPVPDEPTAERMEQAFLDRLERVQPDEIRRGVTLAGPHRDDLVMTIDGADARHFGSQGEQRTAALALKLAEFKMLEEQLGEPPILLLDDVMSDLDRQRRTKLLELALGAGQTMITGADIAELARTVPRQCTIWRVTMGAVIRGAEDVELRMAESHASH
ncbi:MAG: DNA replication/repair protein RecF [Armatimonadetes bacterium]|nr:DNA replication/repair protein RecF [Armatimonadota bacterium]MDE2208036.1 DNA replication/repair protein RecF [Armatimonadota bacterium]